jgi:hypothetical protein
MSFLTFIMGFFMNFELLPISFEEISIFSNGSHLAWRARLTKKFWKGPTQGPSLPGLVFGVFV